jgi:hypothetical protein
MGRASYGGTPLALVSVGVEVLNEIHLDKLNCLKIASNGSETVTDLLQPRLEEVNNEARA